MWVIKFGTREKVKINYTNEQKNRCVWGRASLTWKLKHFFFCLLQLERKNKLVIVIVSLCVKESVSVSVFVKEKRDNDDEK